MEVTWMSEPGIAGAVASVARTVRDRNDGYVTVEDLTQDAWLYLLEHPAKVMKALESGKFGGLANDLRVHLYKVALKERMAVDGTEQDDYFMYRIGVIELLLPEVLDGETDQATDQDLNATIRGKKPINEQGDKPAMLADVSRAYAVMSDEDQSLLQHRYGDGGLTEEAIGVLLDLPQSTVSYRVKRSLNRMAEALNGDHRIFQKRKDTARRQAKSNARAQMETRQALEGE